MANPQSLPPVSSRNQSLYQVNNFMSNNRDTVRQNSTFYTQTSNTNNTFEIQRQQFYQDQSNNSFDSKQSVSHPIHNVDVNKNGAKRASNNFRRGLSNIGKSKGKKFGKLAGRNGNMSPNSKPFSEKRFKNYRQGQLHFNPHSFSNMTDDNYKEFNQSIYSQGLDIYCPLLLNKEKTEISQAKVIECFNIIKQSLQAPYTNLNDFIKSQSNQIDDSNSKSKAIMKESFFDNMSEVSDVSDHDSLIDVSMSNNNQTSIIESLADSTRLGTNQYDQEQISNSSITLNPQLSQNDKVENKSQYENLHSLKAIDTSQKEKSKYSLYKLSVVQNNQIQPTNHLVNSPIAISVQEKPELTNINNIEHENFKQQVPISTLSINFKQPITDASLSIQPNSAPPITTQLSTQPFPTTSTFNPSKESTTDLRFMREKKLSLILDLDNTLLHACQASKLNANIDLMDYLDSNNNPELYKFVLSFMPNFEYYLKLRPFVREFLDSLLPYYELSVFTHATIEYADAVLAILDPDRIYFGNRVATRQEKNNIDEPKLLSRLYPDLNPRFVAVLDDRVDIWQDLDRDQIIEAECYQFLTNNQIKLMKFYPIQSSEVSTNFNVAEPVIDHDQHLQYLSRVFIEIHSEFYNSPTPTRVSTVMSSRKKRTLENIGIFFTGFLKEGKKGESWIVSESENFHKEIAKAFGAESYTDLTDPRVTHVVALRSTTENYKKCKDKQFEHLKKVHYYWLYDCIGTWTKSDESLFDPDELNSKLKPLMIPAQEHWARRATSNSSQSLHSSSVSSSLGVKSLTTMNTQAFEQLPTRTFSAIGPNSSGSVVLSPFERILICANPESTNNSKPITFQNDSLSSIPSWIGTDSSLSISNQSHSSILDLPLPTLISLNQSSIPAYRSNSNASTISPPPYSSSYYFGTLSNTSQSTPSFQSSTSNFHTTYIPSHIFETHNTVSPPL